MVLVDSDFSATPIKAKIADAEQLNVHTLLVIRARDLEVGAVSVHLHTAARKAPGRRWRSSRISWQRYGARGWNPFDLAVRPKTIAAKLLVAQEHRRVPSLLMSHL